MKTRNIAAASLALAATYGSAIAAQSPPTPGLGVVSPPPPGYDPTSASEMINRQFHLPPRPDSGGAPKSYEAWQKAMLSVHNREDVTLRMTTRRHGPRRGKRQADVIDNTTSSVDSDNWSGTSVVGYPAASLRAVTAMFVVPAAHQPPGQCETDTLSAIWPGIDGNNSASVLQAGAEVDAFCVIGSNGTKTVEGVYSLWIEWYPNYETEVSSPAISPGDLVFVEVWNTSPTQGWAYFYDYSTDISAEYSITAPVGTTLNDYSVEWIVERPELGNTLSTLTNYIDVPWSEGAAWDYASSSPTTYSLGLNPSGATLQNITMLDDNGKPISSATIENNTFLWFQNTGSSCGC